MNRFNGSLRNREMLNTIARAGLECQAVCHDLPKEKGLPFTGSPFFCISCKMTPALCFLSDARQSELFQPVPEICLAQAKYLGGSGLVVHELFECPLNKQFLDNIQ